jgi:hypothetical protein
MQCESCRVIINPEFKAAIKNNSCPACGEQIMHEERLAVYLSLRTFFSDALGRREIDVEALTVNLMANFEVKQIFQIGSLPKSEKKCIMKNETESSEEDEPSGPVFDEDGIRYEKVDKDKAQEMLRKMRDDALEEALNDRDIDFTDEEMVMLRDPEARQEQVLQAKQNNARQKMSTGSGGFTRSS